MSSSYESIEKNLSNMTLLQKMLLATNITTLDLRQRRELSPSFHKLTDKIHKMSKDSLESLIKLLEEKIGESK